MLKMERFEVPGLAHYSYVLWSGGQAVVVDPKRDYDTYVEFAAARELRITHILETHIHADYASGAKELAQVSGAELWLSPYDRGEDFEVQFPHREFADGHEFQVGDALVKAVHTPGHTPEHLSFLLHDLARGKHPLALLSGDFLFVGSLGRPDLLGEAAKMKLAEQLYDSLYQRIAHLPDGVEVHPAHGAGSMCGAGMSDRPQSTLGYERVANLYFGMQDRAKFIEQILATVPPFPDYYRRMKRVNSEGARALGGIPGGTPLSPQQFRTLAEAPEAVVIDMRRPEAFGGAHIPHALNVGAGPTLAMWAAWVVPYDRPLLLAGDDSTDLEAARRALIRVGLDDVRGYLKGGVRAWLEAGFPQAHIPQISVNELRGRLAQGAFVLDVRTKNEWDAGHIEGAHWLMAGDLQKHVGDLPRDKTIHVICGTGYRSSIATSVLRRAGFGDVVNVAGGMSAWNRRPCGVSAQ
jgi:hydroxyacylglutathione hydrolase